ncbi:hypothetical protein [Thiocapsa marina]|uniref:Phytase-like domain-containing protein n=1 Tax=Thiocapsa marina 5811 TaxID=768671 RepID=F9U6U6_9GAMM|nr:hypothetical protein [Thiocapsa marina]EGV19972.1 hypothetical protein ThimaDRAFT_0648 [Thiocapsa marina 5811]
MKLLLRTIALFVAATATAVAQDAAFTTGLAVTTNPGLVDCSGGSRVSAVGEIADDGGALWVVPAATHFGSAPAAADLFNPCGGVQLSGFSAFDAASVPVMDAGGTEAFTAFIFADNYFELNVNGVLIAVDPVPFTPFNSNVVRFRADRPVTLAVMGVDWEEHLGLGSEHNRGKAYHPGDAGFVMQVRDASGAIVAITDHTWKAQTFYTAPLNARECLVIDGAVRDSSACAMQGVDDGTSFSAAHWPLPEGWTAPDFDDSAWPDAVTFSNETVGVYNKPAYTNFSELFDDPAADAVFIWSSNLVLDNLVLSRKTFE